MIIDSFLFLKKSHIVINKKLHSSPLAIYKAVSIIVRYSNWYSTVSPWQCIVWYISLKICLLSIVVLYNLFTVSRRQCQVLNIR